MPAVVLLALILIIAQAAAFSAPLKSMPDLSVTLKLAVDEQGAVDDLAKEAARFTSEASLDAVHRLRRDSDAVLVGVETVIRDNPSLTVRRVPIDGLTQPCRVVLDRQLRIPEPEGLQILSDGNPTIVYYACEGTAGRANVLSPVISRPLLHTALMSTPWLLFSFVPTSMQVLQDLQGRGVTHLMVEGGPATARRFLSAGLVDRAIIVHAPVRFNEPVPSGIEDTTLTDAGLKSVGVTEWGADKVTCWSKPGLDWPGEGIGKWP
ncbi:unnamed protein product [Chrysoparadoxa australica]